MNNDECFIYHLFVVISRCQRFSEDRYRLINVTRTSSIDGIYTATGRIEVCSNFTYKSQCDQYWDPMDAQVFCQQYLRNTVPGISSNLPASAFSKELLLNYIMP